MSYCQPQNAYDRLAERGLLYQATDSEGLRQRLNQGPTVFYVGFDPTADSLHVGHLLPVMAMRRMAECGHHPIALVGGATGMIGDPSGKSEARPVLETAAIKQNATAIKAQLNRFLDSDHLTMVDNADWLAPLKYIDFLRDYGRLFSVNRMLAMESVKQRLETGLSFLEFNYMLLQAYDFMQLNHEYNCELQMGGRDQWGNIVAGIELVRRVNRQEVYGLTFPLLLKSDGEKFGKSSGGAVWLDAERTSPYEYYQFWRNVEDTEVTRLLAFFTDLPMPEVKRLGGLPAPAINRAKEILAFETTCLAHGLAAARQAWLAAGREFGFADPDCRITSSSRISEIQTLDTDAELPTWPIGKSTISLPELLAQSQLCKSKSEARRLIRGGGCYIDDQRIENENQPIPHDKINQGSFILRAGKKKRCRVIVATPCNQA